MEAPESSPALRPLASRQSGWARAIAGWLARHRVAPNHISVASVAIEGGLKSKTGDVFNDLPARFADLSIIVPAGYASGYPDLGWCAGALAVFTAYLRTLGGAIGLQQDFVGPMAKQQRMAVLTLSAVIGIFAPVALPAALAAIAAGSLVTIFVRTFRILRSLEQRP